MEDGGSGWLATADQVASVVGASAGVLSLLVAVVTLIDQRRSGASAAGPAPPRRARAVQWIFGLIAVSLFALRSVSHPSGALDLASALLIVVTGVIFLASVLIQTVRWLAGRAVQGDLRTLLTAQLAAAGHQMYDLMGHSYDPRHFYVQQEVRDARGGALTRSTVATALHALRGRLPGRLQDLEATHRPVKAEEMVRHHARVVLTAGPGGGKSTLTARIVASSCEYWLGAARGEFGLGAPYGRVVGVLVPATGLVGHSLTEALAETSGLTAEAVGRLIGGPPLPRTAWLIFVDGLDEIVGWKEREDVLRKLAIEMSPPRSHLRFVCTSRPLLPGQLPVLTDAGAGHFQLREFDQRGLREFAEGWFERMLGDGRTADARNEAVRFLGRVDGSGLGDLARVPLMATMAATVYQHDRNGDLPTGRKELYQQFTKVLREGRTGSARTAEAATPVPVDRELAALARFVDASIDTLLWVAAEGTLTADKGPLSAAADWMDARGPASVVATTLRMHREAVLRHRLAATSLLVTAGAEMAFLHRSIAEYLAAGPDGARFDEQLWRVDLANPTRRSYALFYLARRAPDITAVVRRLLSGPGSDLINAGRILADGVRVADEVEREVVELLLDRVREDHPTTSDCLAVLMVTATGRPALRRRLTGLVEDPGEDLLVRARVAAELFDREPLVHRNVIRALAVETHRRAHVARAWMISRLQRFDLELAEFMLHRSVRIGPVSIEAWGRTSTVPADMAGIALDPKQRPHARLEAALVSVDQPGVPEVLQELLEQEELTPSERRDVAAALGKINTGLSVAVYQSLLRDAGTDPAGRRTSAEALARYGDEDALQYLRDLALDGSADCHHRLAAVDFLARLQDPVAGLALVRIAADESINRRYRVDARRRLTRRTRARRATSRTDRTAEGTAGRSTLTDYEAAIQVMADDRELTPRRLAAADTVVRIDPVNAKRFLRDTAESAVVPTPYRARAAALLVTHGEVEAARLLVPVVLDRSCDRLVRIEAAVALLGADEALGRQTLRSAVRGLRMLEGPRRSRRRMPEAL